MKANKVIIAVVMFILLLALSTQAILFPMPISGSTDVGYIQVEVKNLRTSKIITTTTSGIGEFLVDWSNSDDDGGKISRISNGDKFQIRILACNGDPDCVKVVEYHGEDEIFVDFDVSDKIADCPVSKPCPDFGVMYIIGLILTLIASVGGGIKIYKNRVGNAVFQHRHKGIRGYHDPNTKHINPRYSHRRWKDDPVGCMKDVQKIEQDGGVI